MLEPRKLEEPRPRGRSASTTRSRSHLNASLLSLDKPAMQRSLSISKDIGAVQNITPKELQQQHFASSKSLAAGSSVSSDSLANSRRGKEAAKSIFEKIFGNTTATAPLEANDNQKDPNSLNSSSQNPLRRTSSVGEMITLDLRGTYQRLLQKKAHTPLTWTELWQFAIADVIRTHRGAQMFCIKRKPAKRPENEDKQPDVAAENEKKAAQNKGRTASEIVNFRVTDYLACSTVVITPEMRETLDKPRHQYTEKDYSLIMRLCSRIKSFGKYNSDLQKRLCHCIQYSQFGPGRLIVKQGHRATAFYFIINGQVQVYKTDNDIKIVLSHLSAGDSFGELALIKRMNRTASVVCKTLTEFFWIDEVDFLKVLKTTSDEDNFNKHEFFKAHSLYDGLTSAQVVKQCDVYVKKDTTTNEVIIKECEPISSIYFVRKGSVRLLRIVPFLKFPLSNGQFRYQATNLTSSKASPAFAAKFSGRMATKPPMQNNQSPNSNGECSPKRAISGIHPILVHKLLCVKVLLPGSYFGEECLFGTEIQPMRPDSQEEIQILCPYTVVTCEPCELFRVTRSEFIKTTAPSVVAAMEARKPLRDLELSLARIQDSFLRTSMWLAYKEKVLTQKQLVDKFTSEKRFKNILEYSTKNILNRK